MTALGMIVLAALIPLGGMLVDMRQFTLARGSVVAQRVGRIGPRDTWRLQCHGAERHGPGIAPELLERVFVPFFTTRSGETGIGLALSHQILRLNHGALTADGAAGACRFTLRLPSTNRG